MNRDDWFKLQIDDVVYCVYDDLRYGAKRGDARTITGILDEKGIRRVYFKGEGGMRTRGSRDWRRYYLLVEWLEVQRAEKEREKIRELKEKSTRVLGRTDAEQRFWDKVERASERALNAVPPDVPDSMNWVAANRRIDALYTQSAELKSAVEALERQLNKLLEELGEKNGEG